MKINLWLSHLDVKISQFKMAQEKLAQEHMENMAHQEDSRKDNVVDTEQSDESISQVDTSHLEDSNSEVQPFTISSKCKDYAQ